MAQQAQDQRMALELIPHRLGRLDVSAAATTPSVAFPPSRPEELRSIKEEEPSKVPDERKPLKILTLVVMTSVRRISMPSARTRRRSEVPTKIEVATAKVPLVNRNDPPSDSDEGNGDEESKRSRRESRFGRKKTPPTPDRERSRKRSSTRSSNSDFPRFSGSEHENVD